MKLTIVPIDKLVIVDDIAINNINMDGIDPDIHAVQFDGTEGWIEYKDRDNEPINSVDQFQNIIHRHAMMLAEMRAKEADPFYGMIPEEKLEAVRQAKIGEIDTAFQAAEQQPVSVGGHKFKGGFESGLALDAARRVAIEHAATNPPAGITTVDFFDIYGATVTLPLFSETEIDALDVCLTVGHAATLNSFKCAQLIAAARAATTIEEVNAIKW